MKDQTSDIIKQAVMYEGINWHEKPIATGGQAKNADGEVFNEFCIHLCISECSSSLQQPEGDT